MVNNKKPLLSAIVTNYNGWELGLLRDFFDEFLKNDFRDFEIILVDMNSSDDSVEEVGKYFGKDKRLRIIENPVNNMSAGINMGLKSAKGKYVLFLNNDIYFPKNSLKTLINFLEDHPDVAQVQPKSVSYFNHKIIDSAGETMDFYGNPMTIGGGETDEGEYDVAKEVLSCGGAFSLARMNLVEKVGYLDDYYGIGYEDMDLSLRLRILGYKMFYLPTAVVYHRRSSSTGRASDEIKAKIKFWFNKNRLVTIIRNYETFNLIKSLPVVLFIFTLMGLIEIFYKRLWRFGLSRFTAIGWTLVNIKYILTERKRIQKLRKLSDEEAFIPLMSNGKLLQGFLGFLESKKW